MHKITIYNLKDKQPSGPADVYIDSRTPLRNPFTMTKSTDEERDRVCKTYEKFFEKFRARPEFSKALDKLTERLLEHGELNLFCHCAPKRCHGETIAIYLLNVLDARKLNQNGQEMSQ